MIWQKIKLGDICDIFNGGTPNSKEKSYWGEGLQWITPKDMGKMKTRSISLTDRQITKLGLANSSAKLIPENSVILSCRAPIGHVAINKVPMSFNQGCKGLVPKDELLTEFLYYFLIASKRLLNKLGSGTTFKEISGGTLSNVEIPLPSLSEQQKIVANLDYCFTEIDKNISTTKKQLIKLCSLDSSIKTKLFFSNSKTKKLFEVAEITMGQSPAGSSYNSEGNGYVLINGPVEFTENPFGLTKSIKFTTSPTKLCQKGDALICVRGSTTGRMNIAREKACIGRGVASVRAKENQKWINYFLRSSRDLIFSLGRGATFPNVSQSQIREIEVPYPSSREQNDIIQNLDKLENSMAIVKGKKEKKLDELFALKASILSKALKQDF